MKNTRIACAERHADLQQRHSERNKDENKCNRTSILDCRLRLSVNNHASLRPEGETPDLNKKTASSFAGTYPACLLHVPTGKPLDEVDAGQRGTGGGQQHGGIHH